jgi:hypothetical protein
MLPQKFSAATTLTVPETVEEVDPHAVSIVRSSRDIANKADKRAEKRDENTRSS